MPDFSDFKGLSVPSARSTDFDVSTGEFRDLEIRPSNDFHYFYDMASHRLIKSFVLRKGRYVDTLCDIILIKKDAGYSPRLSFWKRDKTRAAQAATESEPVTERQTVAVKARVDLGKDYESFWKLIEFLRTFQGLELPDYPFIVTAKADMDLIKAFKGHDKTAILTAVKSYMGSGLSEQDVQMLLDRRKTLEKFDQLLTNDDYFTEQKADLNTTEEGVWQDFFEKNTWIFGYGLTLVSCENYDASKLERVTTGFNVFTGGGKRSDAVMRTRGFIQTLLFAEIKKHNTDLLVPTPYRDPDVYRVSNELSGAISQVQKTVHKAIRQLEDLHSQREPGGVFQFEVSTIRPRQVVVIGMLNQLADNGKTNIEKMTSFELYRRDHQGVEILTFDELYERTKYIVESQEAEVADPT